MKVAEISKQAGHLVPAAALASIIVLSGFEPTAVRAADVSARPAIQAFADGPVERFDALGEFAQEEQYLRSLIFPRLRDRGAPRGLAGLYMVEGKLAEAQDIIRRFPGYSLDGVRVACKIISGEATYKEALAAEQEVVFETRQSLDPVQAPRKELTAMLADPSKWKDIGWLSATSYSRVGLMPLMCVLHDFPGFSWAWWKAGSIAEYDALSLRYVEAFRSVDEDKIGPDFSARGEREGAKMLRLAIAYYKKAVQTAAGEPVLTTNCDQRILIDKVKLAWIKERLSGRVKFLTPGAGYEVSAEMSAKVDGLPASDFKLIGSDSVITLQFPRDEAALNRPLMIVFEWYGPEEDGAADLHASATLCLEDTKDVRSVSAGIGPGSLKLNKDGSLTDRETRSVSKLGYPRIVLTFYPSVVLTRPRPIVGSLTVVIR